MFWYFVIKITNIYTRRTEAIHTEAVMTPGGYFEAYRKCVDTAVEHIKAKEQPFNWFIASISDATAH